MIRNHAVMHIARTIGRAIRGIGRGLDQAAHQIGVIIVVFALQQRTDPFQPHAGVDGLHIQRLHRAVLELLVLHKNHVPDFDKPVAVFFGRSGRAAPNVIAVIIKNLGAGTTRSGRPHLPEIIGRIDANNPVFGHADLFPYLERFVIRVVNRCQQTGFINSKPVSQQVPRIWDRLGFEIIAKAEIAQHFEKCMVACGITDIVQVVVFAPRPHAFLRRCCAGIVAFFQSGETVFKLNHARIGKHQCRVIARHQRAGIHNLVTLFGKVVKKGRSNIVERGHMRLSGACPRVALM